MVASRSRSSRKSPRMRKGGRRALKRGLVGLVESPSQLTALNLTTPISPHPSHHIPLTTPISPHPSHHTRRRSSSASRGRTATRRSMRSVCVRRRRSRLKCLRGRSGCSARGASALVRITTTSWSLRRGVSSDPKRSPQTLTPNAHPKRSPQPSAARFDAPSCSSNSPPPPPQASRSSTRPSRTPAPLPSSASPRSSRSRGR